MSDLPQRMRLAAGILREASARMHFQILDLWSPDGLEQIADTWEAEDAANADKSAVEVEELALALLALDDPEDEWEDEQDRQFYVRRARRLFNAGWRKGGPA